MQFDVRGDGDAFEFADDVVEPVRGAVHVRIVNLVGIAGEDDFRAAADTGDDGFDFERREVLRLVNDHELVRNAAPADVAQRLHHDVAGAHQVAAAAVFVAHVQVAQHFQRVVNRLHPRRKFFIK